MGGTGVRFVGLLAGACLVLAGCGGRTPHATPAGYAVPSSGTLRVVTVGDIACEDSEPVDAKHCQQDATARLATSLKPNLVLTLGDHQYDDGSFDHFYSSYFHNWGELRSITRPAVGNHEYVTPGAAGYYDYFRGRQPGPPGYYRVTGAGWNMYVLNSNCTKVSCTTQARWLRQQMGAHPSRCSLITMHHARYSSGAEHGSTASVAGLWDAAYDHRNDVVLAGHDHDYERFKPMDAYGHVKPRRGMTSFVVGTGGRSLYALGQRKAGSVVFLNRSFGVLLLVLRPGSYTWSFRSLSGAQLDSGYRSCR